MTTCKKPPAKAPPNLPFNVGARVVPDGSDLVYEITRVSRDGRQVDICLRRTTLDRSV